MQKTMPLPVYIPRRQPADEFTQYVWTAVIATVVVLSLVAIVFQSLVASYRNSDIDVDTVSESRQIWMGDLGVIPLVVLLVTLGLVAIGLRYAAKLVQTGLDRIMQSLAEILVRLSSASNEVKQTVRFT